VFGCAHELNHECERQHGQRSAPIGFHDQQISAADPVVELLESIAAALDLNTKGAAEQRHMDVALAIGSAGQRHAEARQPERNELVDEYSLYPRALPFRAAAPGHFHTLKIW
jgi:hypothetical protein